MRRLSPRELRRLTRRLGLKMEELAGVELVTIKLPDRQLIIRSPHVLKMSMGGQTIFQIIGEVEERSIEPSTAPKIEISDEDVQLVAAQAGVSLDEAREALIATKGDLAAAILLLQERRSSRKS